MTSEEKLMKYRAIFTGEEDVTMDNLFTGQIPHVAVLTGQRMNGTLNRGNLPTGLKRYLHHAKLKNTSRVRDARYYDPITVTSDQRPGWTLVSMQSTGATNFVSTNMFHEIKNYTKEQKRGKGGSHTRHVECNNARESYLNCYFSLDGTDREASRLRTQVITHRNHINSTLGARDYAEAVAYDFYLETVTELCSLVPEWKVPKPRTRSEFIQKLGIQMCQYDPARNMYIGEDEWRPARKRGTTATTPVAADSARAKKKGKQKQSLGERLRGTHERAMCSSPEEFYHHQVFTKNNRSQLCSWCGQLTAYYGCKAEGCKGLSFCQPSSVKKNSAATKYDCHAFFHARACASLGYCDVQADGKNTWLVQRDKFKKKLWKNNMKQCEKEMSKYAPAGGNKK